MQAGDPVAARDILFADAAGPTILDGAMPDFEAARIAARAAPSGEERIDALKVLGAASPAAAVDVLIAAASGAGDESERVAAIASLGWIARQGRDQRDPRVRHALEVAATSDASPLVVVLARSALEEEAANRP